MNDGCESSSTIHAPAKFHSTLTNTWFRWRHRLPGEWRRKGLCSPSFRKNSKEREMFLSFSPIWRPLHPVPPILYSTPSRVLRITASCSRPRSEAQFPRPSGLPLTTCLSNKGSFRHSSGNHFRGYLGSLALQVRADIFGPDTRAGFQLRHWKEACPVPKSSSPSGSRSHCCRRHWRSCCTVGSCTKSFLPSSHTWWFRLSLSVSNFPFICTTMAPPISTPSGLV